MNTANLQLEGLLVAFSAVLKELRQKGLLSSEDIDAALEAAEQTAAADRQRPDGLSAANVDAVLFPIRFLRAANACEDGQAIPAFSEMASTVGQTKRGPVTGG